MEVHEVKLWDEIISSALTGKGYRGLSGHNVEFLIQYISEKPYMLARIEAKRIEPEWDRDLAEYSIYGTLPSSGNGFEADKIAMITVFRELNDEAQKNETYPIRYDVWLVARNV